MKPIRISEVIYPHEYLWRSVEALKNRASHEERCRDFTFAYLLMAYLAFEAFVNFLGEALCPELWKDERQAFRGQGDMIDAKINALVRQLPGYEWKKGELPYQEIKKLKKFRNLISHGKVARKDYEALFNNSKFEPKWDHEWDVFLEPGVAERSIHAIKEFADSLRVEAQKFSEEPQLVFTAFEGPLASAEGKPVRA